MNEFLSLALRYAGCGWHIFPLHSVDELGRCTCGIVNCSDAGKHPKVDRGLKAATTDPKQIEEWFSDYSTNIGIVTGHVSGITVIDIDTAQGKQGAESWTQLISENEEPQTLVAETGSGGIHLIFKYNSALNTAANVHGKGIDVRNDGGYIVAAPSKHRSGGVYKWENWGIQLADLPPFLAKPKKRGRPRKDDLYRGKYSIEQVRGMLAAVPSDDRDTWRAVGIVLGREFKMNEAAWQLYVEWSDKGGGMKGRNHEKIMHECFYEISQVKGENDLTIGTIVRFAIDNGWVPKTGEVPYGNFLFYGPGNNYIYRPTCSNWIAPAVDAAVSPINENGKIIKASEWLKLNALVTSLTKDPGIEDDVKEGYDCRDGELIEVKGGCVFNGYRRPEIALGDARLAKPFLDHLKLVFNKQGDPDQFLDYMAHRVQKPWEKPRFALMIAGDMGTGKDTAVEFCLPAIGHWNVSNIAPAELESNFNEFMASVLVRISEAANLQDMNKWAFNEQTKVLIAGLPDFQKINPKYGQKYSVRMHCGVIITTNHMMSGVYIPPGDRRYDVIESAKLTEMGLEDEIKRRDYFADLWGWFLGGGDRHVAAFLNERDISGFSPSNGQRKTEAHKSVVMAGMSGDHWLLDALDALGSPKNVRVDAILDHCETNGVKSHEARGKIANAMGRLGYVVRRNIARLDGRWKFNNGMTIIYTSAPIEQFNQAELEMQRNGAF